MIQPPEDWLSHLLATEPANRPEAESALCDLYAASGLPAPQYFFWCDSPFKAVFAMMLLAAARDAFMRKMVAALERIACERKLLDTVHQEMLRAASQPDWDSLTRLAGESLSSGVMLSGPMPAKSVHAAVTVSRLKLYANVTDAASYLDEKDPPAESGTPLAGSHERPEQVGRD